MSGDLDRELRAARSFVRSEWTDERARLAERNLERRQRRRAVARQSMIAVATLISLVSGGLAAFRWARPRPALNAAAPISDGVLRLADGSSCSPTTTDSVFHLTAAAPKRTVIELARGGARFAVTKNSARLFRVEAGAVAVEVVGTRFAMERIDERVRVTVDEGRVRVLWANQRRELGAGESGVFPLEPERASDAPAVPVVRPKAPAASKSSWRSLAQEGDYDRAFEELKQDRSPPRDEPEELLLAADVARLSHHPAEAVAPLQRITRDHAGDPRAPLAAFTLGRLFLDELGHPGPAAEAFALAESLAPAGPLAQDALAREVEAWSRAGDEPRARRRAETYVERFPDGRKLKSVRRFGGLE